MLSHLRSNGLIDFHIDAPFSREFVRLDFLGKPTRFPAGFLHLAWIARAPLVPMLCLGDVRRLRIEFGTSVHPREWQDRESFVKDGLARMVKTLEEQVLREPEQWDLWIRW
jgi:lauroyl/myristoyl acyltransferase